jgi:hypothetical protein
LCGLTYSETNKSWIYLESPWNTKTTFF